MTNPKESKTLGEALPEEMARVRKLLTKYNDPELGVLGRVWVWLIKYDLRSADKAVKSGDLPSMVEAYETLNGWKE
jgi:hypothetical protein